MEILEGGGGWGGGGILHFNNVSINPSHVTIIYCVD